MSLRRSDLYLDLRSVGLFRIWLGIVFCIDILVNKFPYTEVFYSNSGIVDPFTLDMIAKADPQRSLYGFGLMHFFNSAAAVSVFFVLTLISLALFTIGFRARLFAVISLVLIWSIHQRNPLVISGPDELLINLLFISVFLPVDQRFSFFRTGPASPDRYAGFPAFYALFFIGMMYFFQAFLKEGHLWQNGQALSYALMENYWTHSSAAWLASKEELCYFLTNCTFWIEYSIPVLIFFPWRNDKTRLIAAFVLLVFQAFIFVFFEVGLFPLLVPLCAILLLPSFVWDKFKWLPRIEQKFRKSRQLALPAFQVKLRPLRNVILAGMLILILWKASLYSERLNSFLPNPDFVHKLDHTTLFTQYWGFYSPNPSITHGWFRVTGVTVEGKTIDLWSGEELIEASTDIADYRLYPWKVFYYRTVIYQFPESRRLLDNWADYELEKAALSNATDIVRVEILSCNKTITGPGKSTPLSVVLIASSPGE